jgi:6,7-dimethyl-8-ribityllumazine synthase
MKNSFAIVVADFNDEITGKLLEGALHRLNQRNVAANQIKIVHVPGAVEIPLTAKLLAQTNQYAAIICLGAVIRGDTDHYDYVCQQVSNGCQRIMLDLEIPIIFGILTTENLEQAYARVGGTEGHKGMDAADAALKMAEIIHELKKIPASALMNSD